MTFDLHTQLATVAFVASVATLIIGAIAAPLVLARLPADYFVRPREASSGRAQTWPRKLSTALGAVLGALLVLIGVAMLVLPGQGLLTIVAGLSLLPFPGKRKLQRRLLRAPGMRRLCTAIRKRAGKPPLQL